jgi:hypothetical protein
VNKQDYRRDNSIGKTLQFIEKWTTLKCFTRFSPARLFAFIPDISNNKNKNFVYQKRSSEFEISASLAVTHRLVSNPTFKLAPCK